MDDFRSRTRILDPVGPGEKALLRPFLAGLGLDLEEDIELSALVYEGELLVAAASLAGDVVKCVGTLPGREGEGAAARAVSALQAEAAAKGRRRLFVYTKPGNRAVFEELGFAVLATAETGAGDEGATLLESDPRAFRAWAESVAEALPSGRAAGAAVVNCNPFTLGHRWLLERAAAACAAEGGTLLVLVVAGDRSSFPGAVREDLVRAGTADLDGLVVASAGPYCVSGATFPAYYLKEKSRAAELQARLDGELFASRVAPAFGIRRRFVGSEPYCAVTAAYNRALAEVLPRRGIGLVELPRTERGGVAISASEVRRAIREGDMGRVAELVPASTLAWLGSPEARPVIESIRSGSGRH